VSRHVRGLVAADLVVATRDPQDGRATVLAITAAGREQLMAGLRAQRASLQAATSAFTGQERDDLVRLLTKLADALTAPAEERA
jgi:DNA-binding MarR family transcriptional regulator